MKKLGSSVGATAIEAVLVITLLGILAVSANPMISSEGPGLDAALKKMRSDASLAQQKSIVTGINHGIALTADGNYFIYEGTPATPINDVVTLLPFSEDLTRFGVSNIDIHTPSGFPFIDFQVEFDSDGQTAIGGGGLMTWTGAGESMMVQFLPNTGTVNGIAL
jgi:hypothetical protein